jgi:hypothetical protein
VPVASCQFIFRKVKSSVTLSSCLCALFYRSRPAWVHGFFPRRRKSPKPSQILCDLCAMLSAAER